MPVNEPALQRHQENGFLPFHSPHGSVTEAWVNRIDGPLMGAIMGMTSGLILPANVIVTGWIETETGNEDCHTVKYSPQGDLLWENTYAGSPTGTDYGYALTLDPNGNVYVAVSATVLNPRRSISSF